MTVYLLARLVLVMGQMVCRELIIARTGEIPDLKNREYWTVMLWNDNTDADVAEAQLRMTVKKEHPELVPYIQNWE